MAQKQKLIQAISRWCKFGGSSWQRNFKPLIDAAPVVALAEVIAQDVEPWGGCPAWCANDGVCTILDDDEDPQFVYENCPHADVVTLDDAEELTVLCPCRDAFGNITPGQSARCWLYYAREDQA